MVYVLIMCEEYNNTDIYIIKNTLHDDLCSELIRIHSLTEKKNCTSLNKENNMSTDNKINKKIIKLLHKFLKVNKFINIKGDSGYKIYKHKETGYIIFYSSTYLLHFLSLYYSKLF